MLVDQIHLWAITEHRDFVLKHLQAWHSLCQENYLLEWDSIYDLGNHAKKKRIPSNTGDLTVPKWVCHLSEPSRRNFQRDAKSSLEDAIREHSLSKGKSPLPGLDTVENFSLSHLECPPGSVILASRPEGDLPVTCLLDGCLA
jgi:hypothetical protein